MAISFNSIPVTSRVPFAYVEFDNARAVSGASVQPFKILLLGQMLAGGTAAELVPVRVASVAQAKTLFGAGSMLAQMFELCLANNAALDMWACPQVDLLAGVAATGSVTVAGPATASGIINLYIGGRPVRVGVTVGNTAAQIATAMAAAVNAQTSLCVTAAVDGGNTAMVVLTAKHKGLAGNHIDVRANYYGESLPAGVALTFAAFAGGAGNPDVALALAAIGDERFNAIAFPYADAANLTALEAELSDRWGPLTQNDGHAFSGHNGNSASITALGDSRNSPHLSILGLPRSPSTPWEIASALAAVAAYNVSIDPARPLQTLPLKGILAPAVVDRLTSIERNGFLYDGIATAVVSAGGEVLLERVITTYKVNASGADDVSYLDYETIATLSYLRYDFRTYMLAKYPRHKLASDGVRFAPGQAIMTPALGRAEAIVKFRQWEELGLCENIDQFKEELIVERNAQNQNRLDFFLPPNLVNQLRIMAAKIAFGL